METNKENKFEYTIPDGYEAEIKDGKVIIKKKENEDERIRKELLEEIEFIIPHDDETDSEGLILPSYHARIDRYKSYLEKQKEQKPNYCHYGGDPNVERCKYCSAACSGRLTEEQKLAEWSPTKEQMIALSWAANGMLDSDSPSAGDIKASLRTLYNDLQSKSIRPAEWSDEDERMLSNCVSALKEGANGHAIVIDYGEHEKWLNSLPERFNLQSKQEWSEEDEDMLKSIIASCQLAAQDRDSGPAWKLCEMQEKFLKSLRPWPHWKPSKKQIDALISFLLTGSFTYVGQTQDLISLKDDLKKL